MKRKHLLFSAAIAAMFFTDCSKKDNGTASPSATLVGKWQLISDIADAPVHLSDTTVQDLYAYLYYPCTKLTTNFKQDNTISVGYVNSCTFDSSLYGGAWSLRGNSLTTTSGTTTTVSTIIKLTADTLRVYDNSYIADELVSGSVDTVRFSETVTYKKL